MIVTDFVISDETLNICEGAMSDGWFNEARSRPLASALEESYKNGFNDGQAEGMPTALKAERERINNELDYIKHTESLQDFFVTVHLCDVRKIVRGE